MKRRTVIITGAVLLTAVVAVAAYFVLKTDGGETINNDNTKKSISLDVSSPMCNQVPESVVEPLIGKAVVETQDESYN